MGSNQRQTERSGRTGRRRPAVVPPPTDAFAIDTGTASFLADPHRPGTVTLLVNGAHSSPFNLHDPAELYFEYMQWMLAVLRSLYPPETPLRGLHLGGAACALPRAIGHLWPDSRHLAIEIDAKLAEAVRAHLPLPRAPKLRLRVGDALAALAGKTPATCDIIVRDVFDGVRVPPHVAGTEAARLAAQALAPSGVYLVNCADQPGLPVARREAATLATAFPYVAVIAEPGQLRGRRRGNAVLVARHQATTPETESDLARLLRADAFPARLITGEETPTWAGGARPL
ncbi:MAG: fused MFS/spermidine synthase [Bifidobacteriaceae bacterium]|nr:fused MFS/spermidine synthase [Bifidobacteriaceae bacterium]